MTLLGHGLDATEGASSGHPVSLDPEGRRQGTYVTGLNGTGETTLLLNIALADMEAGDGLCVLDHHGSYLEDAPPCREQVPPTQRP